MTEKLKVYIEELINLTENIKEKQTEIDLLKEQKDEVTDKIDKILKEHNLESNTFKFRNHKIQKRQSILYQSLSLKYIHACIENYFSNSQNHNLEDIMDIIKQNRTKKIKSEIKIY
jgi:hypothetical protein